MEVEKVTKANGDIHLTNTLKSMKVGDTVFFHRDEVVLNSVRQTASILKFNYRTIFETCATDDGLIVKRIS